MADGAVRNVALLSIHPEHARKILRRLSLSGFARGEE